MPLSFSSLYHAARIRYIHSNPASEHLHFLLWLYFHSLVRLFLSTPGLLFDIIRMNTRKMLILLSQSPIFIRFCLKRERIVSA